MAGALFGLQAGAGGGPMPTDVSATSVKKTGPLVAGEAEVQTAERSNAAYGHWNGCGHTGHDSPVEQDAAANHLANVDMLLRALLPRSAPTEP